MEKYIELDDFYIADEPTVRIVRFDQQSGLRHIKLASEALDYIKNVKPIPGKTVILVLAMTAGEFYGPNRNGDAWPERPLRVKDTIISEADVLPRHYKTFETHGNVFRHHVNKDPEKRIGNILKAFYNWKMHRVELLIALDNNRASDIVEQIEDGKFPAVSMGCKVKYDVCSICGNRAPNRAAYCDHTKYHMGEFLKNGKRIFVWNPSPVFFDLSMVARPADRLGYMMKKVAEIPEITTSAEKGEKIAELRDKAAMLRKMSLISKIIRGDITAAKTDNNEVHSLENYLKDVILPAVSKMPEIPTAVIREMAKFPLPEVVSTLGVLGIMLTTPEFIKYVVLRHYPNLSLTRDFLTKAVAAQQAICDLVYEFPELLEEISNEEKTGAVNEPLLNKLAFLGKHRSFSNDNIVRCILQTKTADYRPLYADPTTGYVPFSSNMVTVTDPATGEEYQTSEGAIRHSETVRQREYAKRLAPGLLTAGLGTMLSAVPIVGGALTGYGMHQIYQAGKYRPANTIQTEYGPVRYKSTYQMTQPYNFYPETPMRKVSSDHVIALHTALNYMHYPEALRIKIAVPRGHKEDALSKIAALVCC
jgi:hypothetical protein